MITIIDCGSSKVPDIARCLEHLGTETSVVEIEKMLDQDISNSDAFVISGGPIMIAEVDQKIYLNLCAHILQYQKPTLGICLGHQAICIFYGAKAKRGFEDRDWRTIVPVEDHALFDGLNNPFDMKQDHCEEVNMPDGFRLLASSRVCSVEAIIHNTNPIVGVQFHPEVSGENGQRFFENFLKYFDLLSK